MKAKIHNEKLKRRRARGTRTGLSVRLSDRPRVVVFRSAKHIYAQLVDAATGKTLGTVSSRSKSTVGDTYSGNVESAKKVGAALAALAKEKQIDSVVFNRNGFLYHGRVKALADAAREAGLKF